jgi:trimeric autotransporter adhesin
LLAAAPGLSGQHDGPTANDPGDTGANSLQNFPLLTSAKVSRRGVTTIKGTLNSTASTTFTVQVFSSPAMDLEGKRFLAQKSVTTDASGNASFTFKTKQKLSKRQEVTATATNPGGDTSEFSAAAPVS